mmetsp:Transcript_99750/g.171987  ORF Transcript_99750/g.171987 Transcript_99750/m.171987 type:complete len:486 (-) Transcript_99750:282-1739(-)
MCGSSSLTIQPAGLCSERTSEKKLAQYSGDKTYRCRSPQSTCHDGAGASSELLSSQQAPWELRRGRQHCPSEVSGSAGLASERLHSVSSLSVHADSTSRRLRASPSAGEDHAGAPSDLLSAQISVGSSFHRGRRHCPSEVSGCAGLPSESMHSERTHRCGAPPPASYEGAGVPSTMLSSRQVPWNPQRARRRCSSADSILSATTSTEKFLGLQNCEGSLLWELAPAGATSRDLATPSTGRLHFTPSERSTRRPYGDSGPVEPVTSIPEGHTTCPTAFGTQVPRVSNEQDERSQLCSQDNASALDEIGAEDLELTPTYIARWLKSVSSGIPSPVLAGLRTHILKQGINGRMLEDILDHFQFDKLGVEYFTPVHMNRLRKAWYLDHPKSIEGEMRNKDANTEGQRIGLHTSIATPELLATVLNRLSPWAGFDQQAALNELKYVFSDAVCEKANTALACLSSTASENASTDCSPRSSDSIAPEEMATV